MIYIAKWQWIGSIYANTGSPWRYHGREVNKQKISITTNHGKKSCSFPFTLPSTSDVPVALYEIHFSSWIMLQPSWEIRHTSLNS